MNLFRNLIQGAMGGLIGGSLLGLAEATYLVTSQVSPDLVAPVYAVVLYGLIGLPFGVAGGVLTTLVEIVRKLGLRGEATSFAMGVVAAWLPMGAFVLLYMVNKFVYLERGVPTGGKVVVLGALLALAVLTLTWGVKLLRGPLAFVLKGPGALGSWFVMALVTGGVALLPTGSDPRAAWAHGKPVPDGMSDKPNVLVIAVDTLRADYLGTYGKEGDPSPAIDALGADGIVFENAFAAASWTRSSFASLWSSRIPSAHAAGAKAARLPDEVELVSEVLQDAGVTTGNLVNNINVTATFNFDQGWDTFLYESPDYVFWGTESVFSLTFYKVIHRLSEKIFKDKIVSRFYQPAEVVLDDAKGFIGANRDARWFLSAHLMEPHDPYFEHPYLMGTGDAEFNGVGFARAEIEKVPMSEAEYLKKVYLDEIRHMDRKLADFFAWMKAEGLYDDTLIVLTADHGEEFGEHGGFWHGTTLFEEQIHVPLLVKLPKGELAGTRVPWQARVIDVAPTLTAALGLDPGEGWEGRDLVADLRAEIVQAKADADALAAAQQVIADAQPAMLTGEATPELLAAVVAAQDTVARLAPPADAPPAYGLERDRLVVAEQDFEGNALRSIRKDGCKYIAANEGNPRGLPTTSLFDMVADRGETKNLAESGSGACGPDGASTVETLSSELDTVIRAAASGAVSGGEATMDQAEKCKLCALGYLSGPDCDGC